MRGSGADRLGGGRLWQSVRVPTLRSRSSSEFLSDVQPDGFSGGSGTRCQASVRILLPSSLEVLAAANVSSFIGPAAAASLTASGRSPRWVTVDLAALVKCAGCFCQSAAAAVSPNQSDRPWALISIVPGQAPEMAPCRGRDLISQLARSGV